jgi:hypothetical protein
MATLATPMPGCEMRALPLGDVATSIATLGLGDVAGERHERRAELVASTTAAAIAESSTATPPGRVEVRRDRLRAGSPVVERQDREHRTHELHDRASAAERVEAPRLPPPSPARW